MEDLSELTQLLPHHLDIDISSKIITSNISKKKTKQRQSLEELLAAAEEEFDLLDTVVDSAVKTLRTGREIQKLAIIRNFADLLNSDTTSNEAISRVLPEIQKLLMQEPLNLDIHCESAVVFKNIIKNKTYISKHNGLGDMLLECMLQNIEDQKENVTATAWLESLVEVSESIPVQFVVEFIVPLAISQAESTQRVQRRVISIRLIEKMCVIIPSECVCRDLAPCVQMLCRDPNAAIRTSIAQKLPIFAQTINNSTECAFSLLPCMIELCKDDDPGVREAILNTVVVCLPYFTKDCVKASILPLLKKCAEQTLLLRDVSLTVVARQMGCWLDALSKILSAEEQQWFLDIYCRICELSSRDTTTASLFNVTCRRMCAYNFPCFVNVYAKEHFNNRLMPLLEQFCKDKDDEVCSTIALGFHEIVQIRSVEDQHLLINPFVELLQSKKTEVVQNLMKNLHHILPPLYNGLNASAMQSTLDNKLNQLRRGSVGKATLIIKQIDMRKSLSRSQLINILIDCNYLIRKTGSWRSHEAFLLNIAVMRHLISVNHLIFNFVPMLQQEVTKARALPCRIAAAKTLLLMMRVFPTLEQRSSVVTFFTKDIGQHISCHRRRILIDIVPYMLEIFSREFFIQQFFTSILNLADDKVSNIRLQLCKTFSTVKKYFVIPNNDTELSKMEKTVRDLLASEQNSYSRQLVQQFAVELSHTETDTKKCLTNEKKLEEERLWTEIKTLSDINDNENITTDKTLSSHEIKNEYALHRSATAIIGKMPEVKFTDSSVCKKKNTNSTKDQLPSIPAHSLSPLTSDCALPPLNWRTSRPERSKTVLVKTQPKVTVTQRLPSPMPFGNIEKTTDDRKSKLPRATLQYCSTTSTPLDDKFQTKTQFLHSTTSSSYNNGDFTLNKYKPKNSDNIMTRSTSSALPERPSYTLTHSTSYLSLKNIHQPYSLMKVQSTSDVKRKPYHMSIRIISMS